MSTLPLQAISVAMVKTAIGAGANNLGMLCAHTNINMWSRCKPVIYPGIPPLGVEWRLGIKGNSGIVIPEIKNIPADIENTNWTYERPTGGESAPFRLGDFRGYNHNAIPIISRLQSDFSVDATTSKIVDVEFLFINDNAAYPDNINAMDIISPNLQDLCLACAIVNNKGIVMKIIESDGYLYINNTLSIDTNGLSRGEYKLYFYLVNEDKTKRYTLYKSNELPNPANLSISGHTGMTAITYIGWDYNEGYFLPAIDVVNFQKIIKGDYVCFLISLYNDKDIVKVFDKNKFGCKVACLGYEDERYFNALSVMTGGWGGELYENGFAAGISVLPASFTLQSGESKYIFIQIEPCWILDYDPGGVMDLSVSLTYNNEPLQGADISFKRDSGGFQ